MPIFSQYAEKFKASTAFFIKFEDPLNFLLSAKNRGDIIEKSPIENEKMLSLGTKQSDFARNNPNNAKTVPLGTVL